MYVQLGRISNLPTVWTNVLAGAALAGGVFDVSILLPLLTAFTLFYTGGMFLNDAFDRRRDAAFRPDRPIPSGRIRAGEVFGVGYGLLGSGWLIVWLTAQDKRGASVAALILVAAIVTYDAYHKTNPFGSWLMGVCRALIYGTTGLAVAGRLSTPVLAGAMVLWIYVATLTSVAKRVNARPALIAGLIAGTSILDAMVIAFSGHPGIAGVAAIGFPATLLLQRAVRGT